MKIVNITEAKAQLSSLLVEVEKGEKIIIAKYDEPIATIKPYKSSDKPRKLGGCWEGKVKMAADFDETSEELIDSFYD
jgi:prevent-host-death family protein